MPYTKYTKKSFRTKTVNWQFTHPSVNTRIWTMSGYRHACHTSSRVQSCSSLFIRYVIPRSNVISMRIILDVCGSNRIAITFICSLSTDKRFARFFSINLFHAVLPKQLARSWPGSSLAAAECPSTPFNSVMSLTSRLLLITYCHDSRTANLQIIQELFSREWYFDLTIYDSCLSFWGRSLLI